MSCRNRMYSGAMVLMVGLMPPAVSQAHAQATSPASLLSVGVITLPIDTMQKDTDSDTELLGDFALPETELLGSQDVLSLPHVSSGIGSGWLIGGALSAAAGVAGLASGGGGSSAAALLRTPATTPGPAFATETGSSVSVGGGTTVSSLGGSGTTSGIIGSGGETVVSGGETVVSGSAGAPVSLVSGGIRPLDTPGGGVSAGGIGPLAPPTPEPGTLAMFGGMGMALTAVKLRRRKR